MNRNWTVALLALAVAGAASAAETTQASFGDSRLVAGDEVTIDEFVPGNVYLAAGRLTIANRVGGTAVLTGGEVEVTGSIGRNLYVAGGDLRIEGEVEGDARAAGGKIRVPGGARLRGDASFAGGSIEVDGEVGGDLEAYGDSIVINGVVNGDLRLIGDTIRIGPDAHIAGELEYRTDGTFVIDPKAQVAQGIKELDANDHGWRKRLGRGMPHFGGTLFSCGVLLLGALMLLGLPAFSREAAATIRSEWLQSAGVGCLMLVGVPFAGVILMFTVIGIPLALMMVFGYFVLLMLGYLVAAIFVGDLALERLGGDRIKSVGWRVLFLVLALIALSIVRHVPLLGGLAVALLFVAGIGAFTMRTWRGIRQKDDAVAA